MTDFYTAPINTLIEQAKADKSLNPKWRNKAIARLEEANSFLDTARKVTNLVLPPDVQSAPAANPYCTCPEGGQKQDCPVHGWSGR